MIQDAFWGILIPFLGTSLGAGCVFFLKNALRDRPDEKVKIFLATAYNKYGEGAPWNQERVRQFFANEELLVGRDYWNFICDDPQGFDIVMEQYQKSALYIKETLDKIKAIYF